MATVSGIHAITSGIAQVLSRAYQLRPISGISCKFEPLGVSDLKKLDGQDTKGDDRAASHGRARE